MEKNCYMPIQFTEEDLAAMRRIKGVWDPLGLMNPGKLFPTPGRCKEVGLRKRAS